MRDPAGVTGGGVQHLDAHDDMGRLQLAQLDEIILFKGELHAVGLFAVDPVNILAVHEAQKIILGGQRLAHQLVGDGAGALIQRRGGMFSRRDDDGDGSQVFAFLEAGARILVAGGKRVGETEQFRAFPVLFAGQGLFPRVVGRLQGAVFRGLAGASQVELHGGDIGARGGGVQRLQPVEVAQGGQPFAAIPGFLEALAGLLESAPVDLDGHGGLFGVAGILMQVSKVIVGRLIVLLVLHQAARLLAVGMRASAQPGRRQNGRERGGDSLPAFHGLNAGAARWTRRPAAAAGWCLCRRAWPPSC
ncbi:MAG: hypothetical protein GMKNLPBB_02168 [Myxococcota bacterium]|nr:hypothetical protein [Myxococcota bacterium]